MDYLPFVTSLCGAFFGALGAYSVGRFKEKRDEEKQQHSALLAAQYALYSQWSVIEDIRRSFLEPLRKDPDRYLKHTYFLRILGHRNVSFDQLAFVINSDTPNLLQEIHVAEKRCLISIDCLDRINKLRSELQTKYPPHEFDMATGKARLSMPGFELYPLKSLTDILYKEVDEALPDLWNTTIRIREFVKKNLKGRKAIDLATSSPVSDVKS